MNIGDIIEINGSKIEVVGYGNEGDALGGTIIYRVLIDGVYNYLPGHVMELLVKKNKINEEWRHLYMEMKEINETKDTIIFRLIDMLYDALKK